MTTEKDSYEAVAYESEPIPLSRPGHLAALGRLFGAESPDPDRSTVLEVGCASGNNIIPLAFLSPGSTFIGIDFSPTQIELGKELIADLGLTNIELVCTSIEDFRPPDAADFLICHGVFSWVKPAVQEKILELCNRSLTPNGVAYVSYNTLPGWHMKLIVREAMMFHTRQFTDPEKKIREARAYLNFLAFGTSEAGGPYAGILQSAAGGLRDLPDSYLFHDFLEETNAPMYISEFIERSEKHNLRYLCDSEVSLLVPQEFPQEVQLALRKISGDRVRTEQTVDFLRNQMFRQSLLCRKGLNFSRDPLTEPIKRFYISSPLRRSQEDARNQAVVFENPRIGGGLQTSDPTFIRCLEYLGGRWPRSVSYSELEERCAVSETEPLLRSLLRTYLAGSVHFDALPSRFTVEPQTFPTVSPVARALARRSDRVVNLKHEGITLDELGQKVVALADGSRTHEELTAAIGSELDIALTRLAEHSLLLDID